MPTIDIIVTLSMIIRIPLRFEGSKGDKSLYALFDSGATYQLIGNGPYHVYKNQIKGTTFNTWSKTYNNTVTGETWDYPEFKGYYSNFYACT